MNWVAPIKDDETLQKFRDTLRSVDDKFIFYLRSESEQDYSCRTFYNLR